MSNAPKRPSSAAQADVVFLPNLKNCLLNLPSSLVSVLLNANAIAQNVVIELSWRPPPPPGVDPKAAKAPGTQRSVFLGWTGMQSQTKLASVIGRDGRNSRSTGGKEEREVQTVEIDGTLGRLLGLSEGSKVGVSFHIDPPQAHTVNIEPLTPTDWEMIELHAHFLEMNFLSQVRALPNPASGSSHPLSLYLTPTSTANVVVTSLTPAPSNSQPFVKISPDAEVIVAPKTRQQARASSSSGRDNRSTASTSRRSAGGRSTTSRHRGAADEEKARPPLFLRGLSRAIGSEWFEEIDDTAKDEGLKVWVDRDHLASRTLRGVNWVAVNVVKPAGLQEPRDPQEQQASEPTSASTVVARVCVWEDAPDSKHAALSSLLCASLGTEDIIGGIVRLDPAPPPLPRTASALKEPSQQASKDAIVKRLRVTPFIATESKKKQGHEGFRFGGESKAEREEASQKIKDLFGKTVLEGPITDGMLLPSQPGWPGGILDFDPAPAGDPSGKRLNWLLGADRKLEIAVQQETAPPKLPLTPGEALASEPPKMVGIDALITQTEAGLLHHSSTLLTGGLGSGKSSLVQLLAHDLRSRYLFQTLYFPCRTMINESTPVSTIKRKLDLLFANAVWGARPAGCRAVVILDDLDRLCPTETELQVDANGRSKQISELLISMVRQYCGRNTGVVLLATAQGKEAVNNVIIGGHVVRDIVALKAPNKEGRAKVLEMLVANATKKPTETLATYANGTGNEWMDGDAEDEEAASASKLDGNDAGSDLDVVDIAGQTDGYMPGDLTLLVSRARSEALIRTVTASEASNTFDANLENDLALLDEDFTAALEGFTPASLRGVTLQHSTTTFASIGGLTETRQTLLETLQYPTTYAPLFAKCPLRLRSGLLLYGFPGCGKTLLASAVAGECGLNFISVKGPEILNKYIGASEKSVRDLFERAEAAKPCVLFFDEFDSIAPKRGHDSTGVTDRVVNMLLTMMDGAEGLSGVYVLAATSRPDLIDPALLRPGRLDKSLICDMPAYEDRLDILRAVSGKLKLDDSVAASEGKQSLGEIARRTDGYSGADLQAVVYNAHLEAIHDMLGPAADGNAAQTNSDDSGKSSKGSKAQDFTYFQYGQTGRESSDNVPSATPAALAAERAQIAEKLSALQLARRKAKQARHQAATASASTSRPTSAAGQVNGAAAPDGEEGGQGHAQPTIKWNHLHKSLEETRASISAEERMRLARIYKEFVVGRSGEMSDGQGGSEIGGRTSLM
ncbi:hypothetical protein MBLNU230_g5930t1 [Neophaeotheca triangularis]